MSQVPGLGLWGKCAHARGRRRVPEYHFPQKDGGQRTSALFDVVSRHSGGGHVSRISVNLVDLRGLRHRQRRRSRPQELLLHHEWVLVSWWPTFRS